MKYYISNNIHFIQGYGNLVDNPCAATRFKPNDARQYILNHPTNKMMLYGKASRNYVISTPQLFLGNNCVVEEMRFGKYFNSAEEAFSYISENPDVNKRMGCDDIFVIDENFRKIKCVAKIEAPDNIKQIRPRLRKQVRNRMISNASVCAICGKPVDIDNANIDHKIPWSRGGSNSSDNLRVTHKNCNTLKGNFTDAELLNLISDIGENSLFADPDSDMSLRFIRAVVRGTINKRFQKLNPPNNIIDTLEL